MASERSKQISKVLHQFYQSPVAIVSLELILTISLILFLAIFAIRPTLLTMSDLLKEIEDKTTLNERLTQKVAALSTAQNEYLAYEPRISVLDDAIPSIPEIVNALKIIEKIAAEERVIISSISVNQVPDGDEELEFTKKQLIQVPISISLIGDYPSTRRFVEALKENRRTFVIDTVVFSADEDRGQKMLSATVTLNIAYFGVDK